MNSDFKDLLRCLNGARVRYLVIGGYAVSFHAEPRYTKDLDLWVEPTSSNSRRVVSALRKFGAPTDNLGPDDFALPGTLFVFGIPPNRVDILTSPMGVTFRTAWKGRIRVPINGTFAYFIGKSSLKRMKRAAGRVQDLLDLEKL